MNHSISRPLMIFMVILSVLFTLSACSSKGEIKIDENTQAETIYKRAKQSSILGNFEVAIENFKKLESLYPYSLYTTQAQLDLMYALYKYSAEEGVIAQADRFIRFNPTHKNLDYVYYMKGVSQLNIRKSLLDKWVSPKREDYDVNILKETYDTFNELVTRFPNSQYAADSRQRMIFIRNTIAASELQVAEFYLSRYQYVAAANRAQKIIKNHPKTEAARKALITLKNAYLKLGVNDLAEKLDKVIALN